MQISSNRLTGSRAASQPHISPFLNELFSSARFFIFIVSNNANGLSFEVAFHWPYHVGGDFFQHNSSRSKGADVILF